MSLNFLNPSRSYSTSQDCVCFWGHESQFEVAFQIGSDALRRLDAAAKPDEASLLRTFDGHRARIQKAAVAAFARGRQSLYRLSASDF